MPSEPSQTPSRATTSVEFTPNADLFPFRSRWLDSSAGTLHYVDEGDGQAILMCHGNPTWSFLYRHLIGELRDRFRCVAVDYPGFGLSARPDRYGYTPGEHAAVVGELIDELDLSELIVMGHDWGGPIGLTAATANPDRVAGLVLANTWFWPADRRARLFAHVMSSRPLQNMIIKRNLFVERILPSGITRKLTDQEMEHYRRAQPTPESRRGVAELPRQIISARPLLARLAEDVPRLLSAKRTLITFPMRDPGFPAKSVLPRMRAALSDVEVVELPSAKHFFAEDAPTEVAEAVIQRFA